MNYIGIFLAISLVLFIVRTLKDTIKQFFNDN